MTASNLLKSLISVLAVVVILHFLGLYFYWYWHFWWFDIIVHILGGIFVAEVVLYAYLYGDHGFRRTIRPRHLVPLVLAVALVVGVLWECYELAIGITVWSDRGYLPDTVKDICDDVIGAGIGLLYVYSKRPALLLKRN